MTRRCVVIAQVAIFAAGIAFAQQAVKPPEFEVASVKPADPADTRSNSLYTDRGTGLHVENFPLRDIITFAYDIREFQLVGDPGWTATARYDILAKIGNEGTGQMPDPRTMTEQQRDLADRQLRERVRSLLASRFGLVAHHEFREQSIYALKLARGGPKLKAAAQGDQYGFRGGQSKSRGYGITTAMLANELARVTGRAVVDRTGLTGKYDYLLEWTPDLRTQDAGAAQPVDSPGPTIFTALQEQLGLKLESTKGPVDVIVIDHLERPSEN